jgi:hypothetical protein
MIMKIQDSAVALNSSSTYLRVYERSESLKIWVGSQRPDFEGQNNEVGKNPFIGRPNIDSVDLSDQAKKAQAADQTEETDENGLQLSEEDKMKIKLIEKFIETLTGKKFKIRLPEDFEDSKEKCDDLKNKISQLEVQKNQEPAPRQPQGWGLEYDYREFQYEREETSFSAEGIVKTADGQEIAFSINLNMSREFMMEQNVSIKAGDAKKVDPLIINFGGTAAELSTTKFAFDLDSNGTDEQISFAAPGAGFLALDANGDGIINNGSELFGPNTGNGFAELAAYDQDGNSWIDENDSIFSKLRIWTKDANGNDSLVALGQKGIGAIYLGNVSTPFSINTPDNQSLGSVNKSSIYLNENGTVGIIQQIDLTV